MIMKYLLLFLVLFVAYQIWRKQQRLDAAARRRDQAPQQRRPRLEQEKMVPCARCGLMLPVSDALHQDGRNYYCCAEHQQQGPAS